MRAWIEKEQTLLAEGGGGGGERKGKCILFVNERLSVKCLGAMAGVSFPLPTPSSSLLLFCAHAHVFCTYRVLLNRNEDDCYTG